MRDKKYDVVVIGGGASGMMTAGTAAANGAKVLLLEKNKRLGEKLRITGGGRCNITNAEYDLRTLLKNYGKSEQALYSAFTRFGVQDTMELFENLGLSLVVSEDRKRAFPSSNDANDVAAALITYMNQGLVDVVTNVRIQQFQHQDGAVIGVNTNQGVFTGSTYILATGGTSRPETGSTGDGFKWLEAMGHIVDAPTPDITPIKVKDNWVKSVSGIAVKDAKITYIQDSKIRVKLRGDILFTHFGMSGPLILNSASSVADLLSKGPVDAFVDCFPDCTDKDLDEKVQECFNNNGKKQLKNILKEFTPPGMGAGLIAILNREIDFDIKVSEANRDKRKLLVSTLKALPLHVDKLMGFEKAVVADGGVSLKDIDTKTMKSKIVDNLYVTGDLLNIRRPTGGYSLQLSWTSGYLAGFNSAERV